MQCRDVRVAPDRRDRQQVQLRARDGEADGQRVVEAGVAVDDERQRPLRRAERRGPLARPGGAAENVWTRP